MEDSTIIRFGVYELDTRTVELRKRGRLIRLAPQPAKILILLATRAGELVTREEILAKIWDGKSFGEFEQGLNNCINQIRSVLNDNPDMPRFVETLPRRGYRFVAQVDAPFPTAPVEQTTPSPPAIPQSPPKTSWGLRRGVIIGAVVLLLVSAGLIVWNRLGGRPVRPESSTGVLVLPLDDMSADKDQQYLADGLAEELSNELAKIHGLRLIGRTTAIYLKSRMRQSGPGKKVDYASIGHEFKVGIVLDGSVRKQSNRLRIAVQVIDAADGFQLWSHTFENETNDIFAVQQEIARAVIRQARTTLKIALMPGQEEPAFAKSPNPAAYDAYLEGRFLLRRKKEAVEQAIKSFVQSIALDATYAEAWAALGEARIYQAESDYLPRDKGFLMARQAIEHALALDPRSVLALLDMAEIKLRWDWDWTGAQEYYRRALAIAPAHARVTGAGGSIAMVLGQWNEAIALWRQTIDLNTHDANSYYLLAETLYYAGRMEEAKVALSKVIEISPEMDVVHNLLGRIYLAQSRLDDALNQMNAERHDVFRLHGLALVYGAMGRTVDSNRNLEDLIRRFKRESPFQIAEVYAFRQDAGRAFQWLDLAYQAHDPALTELKNDPLMKNLESDIRYAPLLARMRLPI